MITIKWNINLLILIVICQLTFVLPAAVLRFKRDEEATLNDQLADLNPIEHEDSINDGLDREKRKLPDAAFGAKNAVIGFVFSGLRASQAASQQASRPRAVITTPRTTTTTTDDTPNFDRSRVMLDVPDQLFSTSFTTITNISKVIGEFMMNSARRYSRFVQFFKPLLGKALIVKGYEVPRPKSSTSSNTNSVK